LVAIGRDLDVSRERVRQRRVRAFRCIDSRLSRRFTNTARLRAIFTEISSTTTWDDPAQVAPGPWMSTTGVSASAVMRVDSAGRRQLNFARESGRLDDVERLFASPGEARYRIRLLDLGVGENRPSRVASHAIND
jgi:hypothetical protein